MLPEAERKEVKYLYLSPYFRPSISFQDLLLVKSAGSQDTQWGWGSDTQQSTRGESQKDAEGLGLAPPRTLLDNHFQGCPPDNANCPGGTH